MAAVREDVVKYLEDAKEYIRNGRYTISPRPKNDQLDTDFILGEQIKQQILLDLQVEDFSHTLRNEHKRYEHEILYVFGKRIKLLKRFGSGEKTVFLYIKLNKLEGRYIIVISFHQQEYPLTYPFK